MCICLLPGTVGVPAEMLAALAQRLPEQAELRRQRQQQQQQRRQPKGQLPPDQQAELDNSLNVLGVTMLRVWDLGCYLAATELSQLQPSPAAAAAAASLDACIEAVVTNILMQCSWQAAKYAELSLTCWPGDDTVAAAANSSSSSSGGSGTRTSDGSGSGSSSEVVRYGKHTLSRLATVTTADAVPAVFATAHTLASCIDTVRSHLSMDTRELQQELGCTSEEAAIERYKQQLQQSSGHLADNAVLALQLLLLACQAHMHYEDLLSTEERRPAAYNLTPSNLLQLQQQSDLPDQSLPLGDHEHLMAAYGVSTEDIRLGAGKHLAGLQGDR
jgi:hypothetical protein